MHPEIMDLFGDTSDMTRVRFVVVLQNYLGDVLRVRCRMWNDPNIMLFHTMSKEDGAALAKDWDGMLMYMTEKMRPEEVEQQLHVRK